MHGLMDLLLSSPGLSHVFEAIFLGLDYGTFIVLDEVCIKFREFLKSNKLWLKKLEKTAQTDPLMCHLMKMESTKWVVQKEDSSAVAKSFCNIWHGNQDGDWNKKALSIGGIRLFNFGNPFSSVHVTQDHILFKLGNKLMRADRIFPGGLLPPVPNLQNFPSAINQKEVFSGIMDFSSSDISELVAIKTISNKEIIFVEKNELQQTKLSYEASCIKSFKLKDDILITHELWPSSKIVIQGILYNEDNSTKLKKIQDTELPGVTDIHSLDICGSYLIFTTGRQTRRRYSNIPRYTLHIWRKSQNGVFGEHWVMPSMGRGGSRFTWQWSFLKAHSDLLLTANNYGVLIALDLEIKEERFSVSKPRGIKKRLVVALAEGNNYMAVAYGQRAMQIAIMATDRIEENEMKILRRVDTGLDNTHLSMSILGPQIIFGSAGMCNAVDLWKRKDEEGMEE